MATPTVITLDELHDAQFFTYFFKKVGFLVDIGTDQDVGAFIKVVGSDILLQFNNTGANDLIYTLYGLNQDVDVPLDFSLGDWLPLPNGSATIEGSRTDAHTISDNWFWILLRVRKIPAGGDTTLDFTIRTV